jgi:hypothetical protein
MKNYIDNLVELGILEIIDENDVEIRYNVESAYYMIGEADYTTSGKYFIVDYIVYSKPKNAVFCFDDDNNILKYGNPDIFHVCKILNV